MSLRTETEALRQQLDELAGHPDDELTKRYVLRRPDLPRTLYWQLRRLAGRTLRWLESVHLKRPDPWPAALKRAPGGVGAKPLLIWAVGTDRDTLREACRGFATLQSGLPGYAPVLITDVADFAFFSRLGWLVEYLPELAGEGERYENRKAKLLARLYRGAPALPVRAGLEAASRAEEIRRWVLRGN